LRNASEQRPAALGGRDDRPSPAPARAVTSALARPDIALADAAARGGRYAALDAWRGLAALSVVCGHQTGGHVGAKLFIAFYLAVDFFFVLSGFVLAHRYWDELVRDRKPFFPVAIARLARLYPAHVFVLFALLIGFGVEAIPAYRGGEPLLAAWQDAIPPFPGGPGFSTFMLNLLLLQNVGLTPTGLTWNVPSWSISVEFFGSLAVLGLVAAWRKPGVRIALCAIAFAGYALVLLAKAGVLDATYETLWHVVDLGLVRAIAGIAAGVLCLLFVRKHLLARPPAALTATVIELLAITFVLALMIRPQYHDVRDTLFPFAALILVAAFSLEAGAVSRMLLTPPLVYLGSLSYAIYLVHWPLLFVMREQRDLPVWLYYLAVFGAAMLVHHAVEVPGRRFIMQHAQGAQRARIA
jgi:peptidoglycan/LPS O-acetylase OafA/YrhL